ncbi:LysE family translocator [Plastoroseomonas hellenica]|uniref:LysE family translocator n=1 Tax=Plastoroseomonas hellenica TaxID=2687306 RepID=UPI001BAB2F0C|nr:LysE family transporter [Plastoroseomonas hellenica]MBR0641926.1 LysE family transporter [Plastoroseomonas hellenica]
MSAAAALFAILGALLVGVISPGPSFVLVSRIAVTRSRLHGLAAALGMGIGGTIFAGLALLGLAALLSQVEWLYFALKIGGGLYLTWLGIRIWRGAREPLTPAGSDAPQDASLLHAFSFALLTQLSNPKAAIIYGSVFAAMLPASPPTWLVSALPPLVFAIETAWYAIVALAFSASHPRALYLRGKLWIDRLAGGVMTALGLRLLLDAIGPRPP